MVEYAWKNKNKTKMTTDQQLDVVMHTYNASLSTTWRLRQSDYTFNTSLDLH